MTATYDPPRILILLIQMERDHLNNWQALLPVLPLKRPCSGARVIQGEKGISVTTTHWLLRALCGFCTAIAVWVASSRGWGQTNTQLAWKTTMESMEKLQCHLSGVWAVPHSHCMIKEVIESSPETPQSWDSPEMAHQGDSSDVPALLQGLTIKVLKAHSHWLTTWVFITIIKLVSNPGHQWPNSHTTAAAGRKTCLHHPA